MFIHVQNISISVLYWWLYQVNNASREDIRLEFPLPCVLLGVAGFKFSFLWWGNFWIINYIFFPPFCNFGFLWEYIYILNLLCISFTCLCLFCFFQLFIFLHWLNFSELLSHFMLPPVLILLYALSCVFSVISLISLFKSFPISPRLSSVYSLSPCWVPVC